MRIAIVNDTSLAVEAQRRTVLRSGGPHTLAWIAHDGADAIRRCALDRPDVILMDLVMPVMDGVEATRRIMAQTPCAILIVTSDPKKYSSKVFEAMGAGALDVVATPAGFPADGGDPAVPPLLVKLETIGRLIGAPGSRRRTSPDLLPRAPDSAPRAGQQLVVIGASAGGPAAVAVLLGGLPKKFSTPVILIQHIDESFAAGLVSWLDGQTALHVRLARTGDKPEPGEVLVAGSNDHLVFTGAETLGYTPHPGDYPYRPSVDVFFESAARHWRGDLLGVLLTGMGRDGANGLKTLRDKGFRTIAQDQATSAIYGMPKQAAAIGAAVDVLPLERIGAELEKFSRTALAGF